MFQWLKLEEAFEQERQITYTSAQRGGVLGLLLHQTTSPDWTEKDTKPDSDHDMDIHVHSDSESSSSNMHMMSDVQVHADEVLATTYTDSEDGNQFE